MSSKATCPVCAFEIKIPLIHRHSFGGGIFRDCRTHADMYVHFFKGHINYRWVNCPRCSSTLVQLESDDTQLYILRYGVNYQIQLNLTNR